ncbi:MAG: hypothetical protein EBT07_09545 [Actinobacteria bacterium]|nr:hypothetical protein [Actinomycetota bacterium]
MPTPSKPLELKRKLGNPGRQKLPKISETIALPAGYVEPHQPLGVAGKMLWERVFGLGQTWISPRSDVELLLIVCKQLDRQLLLEEQVNLAPADFHASRQLLELENAIVRNLGLLGLSVDSRSKLGLAEIKAETKLEQLKRRQEEREQARPRAE